MQQATLIRTNSGLTDLNLTVYLSVFYNFLFRFVISPQGGLILFTGKLLTNIEAGVSRIWKNPGGWKQNPENILLNSDNLWSYAGRIQLLVS